MIGPESIPVQVRVLDHSTKMETDNLVKGTKSEEREKGEDFLIKMTDPGSFVIEPLELHQKWEPCLI